MSENIDKTTAIHRYAAAYRARLGAEQARLGAVWTPGYPAAARTAHEAWIACEAAERAFVAAGFDAYAAYCVRAGVEYGAEAEINEVPK